MVWRALAVEGLEGIHDFIAADNRGRAASFVAAIRERAAVLRARWCNAKGIAPYKGIPVFRCRNIVATGLREGVTSLRLTCWTVMGHCWLSGLICCGIACGGCGR